MKKIIISGATSMIGTAIVRCALKQGLEITCIVRKDSSRLDMIPKSKKVETIFANLNEYADIRILGRYDVFFNLAWYKSSGVLRDDITAQIKNIQYTMDAVHLAKRSGCSVFIGAGSQAEYGNVSEPLKINMPVNPSSSYGIAKYAAGKASGLLCAQLGIRHNWVRILSVFGQNDAPHTLIMYTINKLLKKQSLELTKCEQIWDYLYCDDVAKALLAIAEKGVDGKAYPLGSGMPRKLSDYIEAIRDIINPDQKIEFGKKEYYPHQPMYLNADISELTKDTGWKPKISFEEGIKNILMTNI